jgi:hypothetical protein
MSEVQTFTARASLAALGVKFNQLALWRVIENQVHIRQKVRQHTPLEKLLDCFITILAGGHGLVEINTLVRPDRAVQCAFGRVRCAEQSTISDTLNACTTQNVHELRMAVEIILRQHGRSYPHDYRADWQLFDVDMTGLPAGRLSEGATKGYFANRKNCRGRQLGRVIASHYDEVIVDRLYEGQLDANLPDLITQLEQALNLTENQRKNSILRIDGGGGSDNDINWMCARAYHLLVKTHNWQRAVKLATTVAHWYPDPKVANREIGWVGEPHAYAKPTRQLAVRKRKSNGEWRYQVLVFTLTNAQLSKLAYGDAAMVMTEHQVMLAAVYVYDGRGGGAETQNKNDKQGLGLSHRNKQKFVAQEMLVLLTQLAHNFMIWTRNELSHSDQRFEKFGILRTVRDVLQIPGYVQWDADAHVKQIVLNQTHPLAVGVQVGFATWCGRDDLSLNLGKI